MVCEALNIILVLVRARASVRSKARRLKLVYMQPLSVVSRVPANLVHGFDGPRIKGP